MGSYRCECPKGLKSADDGACIGLYFHKLNEILRRMFSKNIKFIAFLWNSLSKRNIYRFRFFYCDFVVFDVFSVRFLFFALGKSA